jgi:HTH-type transcriptional regulator/antitoxin HigA
MQANMKSATPDSSYMGLIHRFSLVPIKTTRQLKSAFAMLDELAIIDEDKLTSGQADYLQVLSDLVERYEDAHFKKEPLFKDGVAALQYLLDQAGMSASELGRTLGNRQLGAAILRRERKLSKAHIVMLAGSFGVSTDLFLRPNSRPLSKAS